MSHKHEFKDGDWATWTEFLGSEYKIADLERSSGKGPFQLQHVGEDYAQPNGIGSLWDIRYFKPASPPETKPAD